MTSASVNSAACSFQRWKSRNASRPSAKTSRDGAPTWARTARSVSTEYDGPGRSSSRRETRKPGTPATASSTMRSRSAAPGERLALLVGGERGGDEPHLVQALRLAHLLRGAQVPEMDRVERPA